MLIFGRKQQISVKQLSFDSKKIKKENFKEGKRFVYTGFLAIRMTYL